MTNFNKVLALFICSLLLCGCVMPIVQVKKDADLKKYREVYLIKPKKEKDPIKLFSKVKAQLKKLKFRVHEVAEDGQIASQGTGFIITEEGYFLTAAHVIGKDKKASVWVNSIRYEADLIDQDEKKDIALLKIIGSLQEKVKPLPMYFTDDCKMGQEVYSIGFPLSTLLGNNARLNKGLISSTVGLKDDPLQLQISVEVQPGNSGSPLLNSQGTVIGLVQSTINPFKVLYNSGNLPQNVNFALKSSAIKEFLGKNKVVVTEANKILSFDDVKNAVIQVRPGIVSNEEINLPKLVAVFCYDYYQISSSSILKYFIIDFYDMDTSEMLIRGGQWQNLPQNEVKIVLDKTFKGIKEKIDSSKSTETTAEQKDESENEEPEKDTEDNETNP
ncbi:MAG: serine protease [bacterium]|nr:serine protease [bacterium]